jgi:hypothetical protein
MSIPDSSPQSVRSGVIQAINAITYAYHQNNGNTPGFYTIYLYETYFDGSVRLVGHTWISESDMKLRAEGGMAGRIDVQNRCIAGVEQ